MFGNALGRPDIMSNSSNIAYIITYINIINSVYYTKSTRDPDADNTFLTLYSTWLMSKKIAPKIAKKELGSDLSGTKDAVISDVNNLIYDRKVLMRDIELNRETYCEIVSRVEMRMIERKVTQYLQIACTQGKAPERLQKIHDAMKALDVSSDKTKYIYLVTVSFRDGVTPDTVVPIIDKVKTKVFITKWLGASHEQRGKVKEDCGKGYHLHVLFETAKSKGKVEMIREFYNTFKSVVDSKNFVNVVRVTNNVENVVDYLNGIKADEGKQDAILIDKQFKQQYGVD